MHIPQLKHHHRSSAPPEHNARQYDTTKTEPTPATTYIPTNYTTFSFPFTPPDPTPCPDDVGALPTLLFTHSTDLVSTTNLLGDETVTVTKTLTIPNPTFTPLPLVSSEGYENASSTIAQRHPRDVTVSSSMAESENSWYFNMICLFFFFLLMLPVFVALSQAFIRTRRGRHYQRSNADRASYGELLRKFR